MEQLQFIMLAEVVVVQMDLIFLALAETVEVVEEEVQVVHQVQVLLQVTQALPIEAVEVAPALTLIQELVVLVVKV
jgi:hypothetical protein